MRIAKIVKRPICDMISAVHQGVQYRWYQRCRQFYVSAQLFYQVIGEFVHGDNSRNSSLERIQAVRQKKVSGNSNILI